MPAPVHEQVQQWTGGQQEPGQHTEQVRPMLDPEKERGDRQKHAQRDAGRRREEAPASSADPGCS